MPVTSRKPLVARIVSVIIALILTLSGCGLGETPRAETPTPGARSPSAFTPTTVVEFPTATTPVEAAATPVIDRLAATLTAVAAKPAPTAIPTFSGTPTAASEKALAYLRYAVDYIRLNALYSDRVDWNAVERVVFGSGQKAQTTEDTYPAIRYALKQLGDNHSFFMTPDEAKQEKRAMASPVGLMVTYSDGKVVFLDDQSPAGQAGVLEGDIIKATNGTPLDEVSASGFFSQLYGQSSVKLTLQREGQSSPIEVSIQHEDLSALQIPQGRRLEGGIGYIMLPPLPPNQITNYYADMVQQIIEDIDREPTCGWIVDLQQNQGGNMWPMLAGIGPVLGEGQVGASEDRMGTKIPFTYDGGAAIYGSYTQVEVQQAYTLKRQAPPVAVLTSGMTASSGEIVLISFRGRPDTRTFGEPSAGMHTGNTGTDLSDGAVLSVTNGRNLDRTGRSYESAIPPDESVAVNAALQGTDNDPVLQAAVRWLKAQPTCAGK